MRRNLTGPLLETRPQLSSRSPRGPGSALPLALLFLPQPPLPASFSHDQDPSGIKPASDPLLILPPAADIQGRISRMAVLPAAKFKIVGRGGK